MKRRILAFLCVLAIMMGLAVAPVTVEAASADGKYDVGYAKKDINPLVNSSVTPNLGISSDYLTSDPNSIAYTTINNPNNQSQTVQVPIVKVQLSGYGSTERLATTLCDDNADGLILVGENGINNGDGVNVTATTVTDDWGKTVVYITVDALGAFSYFSDNVRDAVITALGGAVSTGDIVVSGSHAHGAPNLESCYKAAAGTAWRAYYDYCVAQAAAAAQEAYEGRTAATMTKGSIDASEATDGYQMNFTRHYKVKQTTTTLWSTSTHEWVAGDNFGGMASESASGSWWNSSETTLNHVSEVNDTMNILQFTRTDAKPIVLIQWQAHPSMLSSGSKTNVTSDYVNALRYRLENNSKFVSGGTDYCVGFWQGTGGNINPTSKLSSEYAYWPEEVDKRNGWIETDPASVGLTLTTSGSDAYADANRLYASGLYGYIMATVALKCLKDNMSGTLNAGRIRTVRSKYIADKQQDSEYLYNAALEFLSKSSPDTPYRSSKQADGNYYVINSTSHANNIKLRYESASDTVAVELNAWVLGSDVAMVTSPLEMFDRYSGTNTLADTSDNDWDDLEAVLGFKPFVLSLTNGRNDYLPNNLAYTYYTYDENKTTVTENGSYEANITEMEQGTGEEIIKRYALMLNLAKNGFVEANCPKCCDEGETVEWEPLTADDPRLSSATSVTLGSGHYYLAEDVLLSEDGTSLHKNAQILSGETLCLNLNGHRYESVGRAFYVNGGTFNLLDTNFVSSGSNGVVKAFGANNNAEGGVMYVAGTFNMYGGTLEFEKREGTYGTGRGGIISLYGVMHMYGGTIQGAELVNSTYSSLASSASNGCGGAIYLGDNADLYVYGGEILSGTATKNGPCVFTNYSSAQVFLYNDATVEDIYFDKLNDYTQSLNIPAEYTGKTNLSFLETITADKDIGVADVDATNISDADISVNGAYEWRVVPDGKDLLLQNYPEGTVALIGNTPYSTLQAAVDGYTSGKVIRMIANEIETETVVVNNNVYLDMNGCNIDNLSVNTGYTLYCKDSATDDYTVSDNAYGKLTNASGTVKGVPEEATVTDTTVGNDKVDDGYLKINESNALSFHRVNLDLTHMTLTPMITEAGVEVCAPSVTYKGAFKGDEKVAAAVASYGVAVSIKGEPNATNLNNKGYAYSTYKNEEGGDYEFVSGNAGNAGKGTLLKNIMKPANTDYINNRNAGMNIYGRAYIKIGSEYMFGATRDLSLRQAIEKADEQLISYELTQQADLYKMFANYKTVMNAWNVFNLMNQKDLNVDGVLSILAIGGSDALDSMQLLNAVYQAEKPGTKLKLGVACKDNCSLSDHVRNYTANSAVYTYYSLDSETGTWTTESDLTLKAIIQKTSWDTVALQQSSALAGVAANYGDYVSTLQGYVSDELDYTPNFAWNLAWSYPQNIIEDEIAYNTAPSNASAFNTNYSSSQQTMYDKIVEAAQNKIADNTSFKWVMPVGTAVQNAKSSYMTDWHLFRDSANLSDFGRLMAAYTWYCQLEGKTLNTVKLTTIPKALSVTEVGDVVLNENQINVLVESVKNAGNTKYSMTQSKNTEAVTPLRVLVLGNSHGLDATRMLRQVFYKEVPNKPVVIGALYYAGAMVSEHNTFITNNSASYEYHKNDGTQDNSAWVIQKNVTYKTALQDEPWDIILMQQMNTDAGALVSCIDGTSLLYKQATWENVAKTLLTQGQTTPILGYHMVWANPDGDDYMSSTGKLNIANTTGGNYDNWVKKHTSYYQIDGDGVFHQKVMYEKITDYTKTYIVNNKYVNTATNKVVNGKWMYNDYFAHPYIMASGTAIQYAQTNLDTNYTQAQIYRDYTHMSDYGRLICAYQWFAQLMGIDQLTEIHMDSISAELHSTADLSTFPEKVNGAYPVSEQMKADLIESVNWALANPFGLPEE